MEHPFPCSQTEGDSWEKEYIWIISPRCPIVGLWHSLLALNKTKTLLLLLILRFCYFCRFLPACESTLAAASVFLMSCWSIDDFCRQRRPLRGHLDHRGLVYTDPTTGHRSRNNQEWAKGYCPQAKMEYSMSIKTQESSQKHLKVQELMAITVIMWSYASCTPLHH